jgi:hypothetical protein
VLGSVQRRAPARLRTVAPLLVPLALIGCAREPVPEALSAPATAADLAGVLRPGDVVPLDQVAKSQEASVSQNVATTTIAITYSRPVARGRTIFGGIVPYGETWNPGANRATEIAVDADVEIGGRPLPAGAYTIWMIPRPDAWTIIFSRATRVRHLPYPGEAQDALRFDVQPVRRPATEVLTFDFPFVEGKDATLEFRWGDVSVPLGIRAR